MAFTLTARGTSSGYAATTDVGNTFEPTEGNVIVVATYAWNAVSSVAATNWNITFSQWGSSLSSGGGTVTVFAGIVGSSPTSDAAEISLSGGSNQYAAVVIEIEGADTSGTVADILGQAAISSSTYVTSGTSYAISTGFASAFGSATNGTLIVATSATGTTDQVNTATGFTAYGATNNASVGHIEIHFDDAEEQDPEFAITGVYATYGGLAFEIEEESVGGGGGSHKLILLGVG